MLRTLGQIQEHRKGKGVILGLHGQKTGLGLQSAWSGQGEGLGVPRGALRQNLKRVFRLLHRIGQVPIRREILLGRGNRQPKGAHEPIFEPLQLPIQIYGQHHFKCLLPARPRVKSASDIARISEDGDTTGTKASNAMIRPCRARFNRPKPAE